MSIRTRLLAGLGVLLALLIGWFAAVIPAIHRWGATDEEVSRVLPDDELLPEQIWPWIAQLGDTRACSS
jgi:hypothetical protein